MPVSKALAREPSPEAARAQRIREERTKGVIPKGATSKKRRNR
jgi:hypothetical protein